VPLATKVQRSKMTYSITLSAARRIAVNIAKVLGLLRRT
jgi:hypothetical protein